MTENINNKLDEALEEWHSKLSSGLSKLDKIYHYTNFAGLRGIVESQRMQFTDFRFLNDPTELEFTKKIIMDELVKYNFSSEQCNLVTCLFAELASMYKVYISCFSIEHEKLSLWRYYANNGTGFAIGFGKNYFSRATKMIMMTH